MPYIYKDPSLKESIAQQTCRSVHSSGKTYEQLKSECLSKGVLFEDVDFPANDSSLFYSEKPSVPFVWKRPKEMVADPEFILGGASRTDVCQGDLADLNEFWSALLEKAYAKLNGSYEALKGGSTLEAMEDFTGGVTETYEIRSAPANLFEIMDKALKKGSMLGCSIDISSSSETEAKTPQGLVKGHAYSITATDVVNFQGQKVKLIRIRNPWGQVEWNGAWSDNSSEWNIIGAAEKNRLSQASLDDGEFCLKEQDEGQKDCTFIAALMQKNRRKLRKTGADLLTIGYTIYQCPGSESILEKDFFKFNASKARSKTYVNLREVCQRFKLPPGDYMFIPTTYEPHQEADFCLRIFSEKKADIKEMDGEINVDLPDPTAPTPPPKETEEERQFRTLFEQISGQDLEVSAEELQYVLNSVLRRTKNIKFKEMSLLSCNNIISLMDTSGNGKLGFDEFKIFWDKLKTWIGIFMQYDLDRSGTMSSYELRLALKSAGFHLNNIVLQLIVLRYADDHFQIEFDDFLNCLIRLENSYSKHDAST
ncbi:hypothetical protein XELAEV_18026825mg [Xenopus laevis]|uniref:Calpain-9 n=1 Tax=Xenopus laevis TaxID=8355 RepID=A0A974CUG9_XENLA|nr:hypothetical protein XELAEV_18026825mg [Xenopus laevis]